MLENIDHIFCRPLEQVTPVNNEIVELVKSIFKTTTLFNYFLPKQKYSTDFHKNVSLSY